MAKVIAVATHKGGQAKTSTVKNLALAASEKGKTLLIDLDPQYSLTRWVGAQVFKTIANFYEGEPIKNTVTSLRPNLDIIGGSLKMEKISQDIISRNHREYILKRGLYPILDEYDYIIMDTPPSLGSTVQNAIIAADLIVIPVSHEAGSTEGLLDFVHLAEELIEDKPKFKLVLTKVDKRKSNASKAIQADLTAFELLDRVAEVQIPIDADIDNSNIGCIMLDDYNKNSESLKIYRALFKEVDEVI
jgi:chromosome partitioning protein